MTRQFTMFCRYCGKAIRMMRNDNGQWIPCDTNAIRFLPAGGPETFINERGNQCRGVRDMTGEFGYKRHTVTCEGRKFA